MNKHETFMKLAETLSELGTCNRLNVGVVLVNDLNQVIASGYNGNPKGMPHCNDIGCNLYHGHCISAIHAEENAILQCAMTNVSCLGTVMDTTHLPCYHCCLRIIQARIYKVIYKQEYGTFDSVKFLNHHWIKCLRLDYLDLKPTIFTFGEE